MGEIVLKGDTDAGNVVLFDPAALPVDFDARYKEDEIDLLERLSYEGKVIWPVVGGDGEYWLSLNLESGLPDRLSAYVDAAETSEGSFYTPTGHLVFVGSEYVYREDDSFLRKHPGMATHTDIPPGTYAATLYTLKYPDGFEDELFKQRLNPAERVASWWMDRLGPLGCLGPVALILTFIFMPLKVWVSSALPVGLLLTALPFILNRTKSYRSAEAVSQAISKEYPSFALVLRKDAKG